MADKTTITPAINDAFNQARSLVGFDVIKDTFLAAVAASPVYTDLQKAGIIAASGKLLSYPDGPLVGILNMTWADAGLNIESLIPLASGDREAIMSGVMDVCKDIITAEAARLTALAALDTTLPTGWNAPPAEEPAP